jgi:hypothetical protein
MKFITKSFLYGVMREIWRRTMNEAIQLLSSSWEKLYVPPRIVPNYIIDDWIWNIRNIKEDFHKEIWAWCKEEEVNNDR